MSAQEGQEGNAAGSQPDQAEELTAEQRMSHIESLMARLTANSPIYNMLVSTASLVSVTPGVVTTHLTLTPAHVNSRGGLHGAVSAAIIDFTTGLSIAAWDLRSVTGASVDMHISYLSTAAVGDELEIVATAERVGGNLAFTTARLSKIAKDGERKLVVLGQHTKYVNLPNRTK
ncbi:hypothetical protein GMORB2_4879 [Geosmithia morbida]|uniref:Thioesterase domain-containing protein n=1 Tax=Geosmithia morbida TaxID=1094350 RepID=A0A9P5D0Z4_9HYPO|nr:uncharacterized protein GMORB2_4879 [Geosmithia morbida]KAF4119360.1 hypothetical protein GMORB2_4879 [Geosmithia morbida]